jgi:cell fate regulator YaaT (PSP1 superfamily)
VTDFASDPKNGGHDAAKPLKEEAALGETIGATLVEEGLAMHIVEPDDPDTIFVAVAEPTDELGEPLIPCETEEAGIEIVSVETTVTAEIPRYGDLIEVAAIRLGGLGPALFFLCNGMSCSSGDNIVVAMEEGHVHGCVASVFRMDPEHLETLPTEGGEGSKLRPVVRKASEKDDAAAANNEALAKEALDYCRQCIRERDLDMKLVDVLVLHDRSKMIFYFTAPARIDFRELVKDLVRRYRTRIELRQIGVRHETQMVGALGNCGMVCCCRRYLRKFAPVAIKMAKEQNVFLNPVKISGSCGRLLCCLAYEQEHYDEFYRSCPKLGKKYHTDAGVYRVLRASLFRESVTVLSETGVEVEYPLTEWNALIPFRSNASQQNQSGARKPEGRPTGEDKGHKSARSDNRSESRVEPRPNKKPWEKEAPHTGETLDGADAMDGFDDLPEFDSDREISGDTEGGSIFRLAPHREGVRESDGGDASGRRKRPLRRHNRKKPQSDSQ